MFYNKCTYFGVSGHPGNRFYRACSLSGSDGETDSSPTRPVRGGSGGGRPRRSNVQHTYHLPAGLSDSSPNSDNVSNATLTDSEVALARDTTLLAHKSEYFLYASSVELKVECIRSKLSYNFPVRCLARCPNLVIKKKSF